LDDNWRWLLNDNWSLLLRSRLNHYNMLLLLLKGKSLLPSSSKRQIEENQGDKERHKAKRHCDNPYCKET